MSDAVQRRLAVEAEADRLAALYERVLLAARAERVGFLEAGREAAARRLVSLGDWDLLPDGVRTRKCAGRPVRANGGGTCAARRERLPRSGLSLPAAGRTPAAQTRPPRAPRAASK